MPDKNDLLRHKIIITLGEICLLCMLFAGCNRIELPVSPTLPMVTNTQVNTPTITITKSPIPTVTATVTPIASPPTPAYPLLENTPLAQPNTLISAQTADQLIQLAQWNIPYVGSSGCLAFSPTDPYLAISNGASDVFLWDIVNGHSLKTFHHPEEADFPHINSIAFSPDGVKLAIGGVHKVSVWDITSEQLLSLHEIEEYPTVAFTPDGSLLVISYQLDDRKAFFWDINKGLVQELGDDISYSAYTIPEITFDGTWVVVSGERWIASTGDVEDWLAIWEAATGKERFSMPKSHHFGKIALSPDGRQLVLGGVNGNPSELWDIASGEKQELTGLVDDVDLWTFSVDGKLLASASVWNTRSGEMDSKIRLVNPSDGKALRTLQLPHPEDIVFALAFSPDGRFLAVYSMFDGVQLWGIPKTDDSVIASPGTTPTPVGHLIPTPIPVLIPTLTPVQAMDPATAPLPAYIAYVRGAVGHAEVYFAQGDGSGEIALPNQGCDSAEPAWAPDGLVVVYQSNCRGSYDLWAVNLGSNQYTELTTQADTNESEPNWSPDGGRIAYRSNPVDVPHTEIGDLMILDLSTMTSTKLGRSGRAPEWSPNGRELAYMSNEDGVWQIYVYDFESRVSTQLTDWDTDCRWPTWSPDGRFIAYNTTVAAGSTQPNGIWKIRAKGGYPELLLDGPYGRPTWAGTGWLAVNTTESLYIMASDGSGLREWISGDSVDTYPWAPAWSSTLLTRWPATLPVITTSPVTIPGTQIPQPDQAITLQNAGQMIRLAQWGIGYPNNTAWVSDEQFIVGSSAGLYFYTLPSLANTRAIDTGPSSITAFSPDNTFIATFTGFQIHIWEAATGNKLRTIVDEKNISALAFSPDGKTLLSGKKNGELKLWDVVSGQELREFNGHTSSIQAIAFSPNAALLVSVDADGNLKLWNPTTGVELQSIDSSGTTVAFSPDGRLLAFPGKQAEVVLWDTLAQRQLGAVNDGNICVLAFSSEGTKLASGSCSGQIKLWDVASGNLWHDFGNHADRVISLAFSPSGKILTSVSADTTLILWDTETGERLHSLDAFVGPIYDLAMSPDGLHFVTVHQREFLVKVWDLATGKETLRFGGMKEKTIFPYNAIFSPDGKALAVSGSFYGDIPQWDVTSGAALLSLGPYGSMALQVAYSPDGRRLASIHDSMVVIWDTVSGEQINAFQAHNGWVMDLSFSPDGTKLVTGGWDGYIKLWNVSNGKLVLSFHTILSGVDKVIFSPDGYSIAAIGTDGVARVWNTTSGQLLRVFDSHYAEHMAFSPDGTILALASYEGIYLWDIANGQALAAYAHPLANRLAFSPDGKLLLSGSGAGTIAIWGVAP